MQALASAPAPVQTCPTIITPAYSSQFSHAWSCYASPATFSCRLRRIHSARNPLDRRDPIGGRAFRRQRFQVFAAGSTVKIEKWVLQPIGDGDSSHLDEAVPLPGAFELLSDAATVGRVAGKADIVIPVATVSGVHARLEKKIGTLFVTDLDSTNGTYVNDTKIRPGAVTPVPPGSRITFGDDHLAAFQFAKVEEEIPSAQTE